MTTTMGRTFEVKTWDESILYTKTPEIMVRIEGAGMFLFKPDEARDLAAELLRHVDALAAYPQAGAPTTAA